MSNGRSDGMLTLIGVFKLVKVVLLVAVGLGALEWMHAPENVAAWINSLGIDPENKYVDKGLATLTQTDLKKFEEVGIGSFVYAALFAVEGFGLVLKKVWAEYVTIVITTSFIPLEVYEMVEHESVLKGLVILANVAIVVYLVLRLRSDHRWPFKKSS